MSITDKFESMKPCVYCGAPWPDPVLEIEHRQDCSFNTNLFPVLDTDIEPHGFCCLRCSKPFEVGEFFTHIPFEDTSGHTHDEINEVACLSCAAKEALKL